MAIRTDIKTESQYPRKPFLAGIWLIAALPIAVMIMFPLNSFIHRQSLVNQIGLPLVGLAFSGTAYLWANTLLRRSGWEASWRTGLAGALGLVMTILGVEFRGYDLIFANLMKLFNVTQTVGGTNDEFYVVFVTWTGIVTGGCGLAIGLAIKRPGLALKLLGSGFLTGALVFLLVALAMERVGFQVGTVRPDGIPSMPVVTILGIWITALIGSELFGRLLARHQMIEASARGEIETQPEAVEA